MNVEIGLMSGTFYNISIFDALRRAKEYKINNVEILVSKGHFDIGDERTADDLYDFIVELQLKISSVHSPHTPYWQDMDISSSDESNRRESVKIVKECIDFMSRFYWEKIRRVVVHPGGEMSTDISRRKRSFYESMNEIIEYSTAHNVNIALENMLPHLFGGDTDEFLEIIAPYREEKNFGICFDTSHANLTGRLYDFLEELLNNYRVLEFHVSDNNGSRDDHLLPFMGEIDWFRFLNILKRHPGGNNFMLEINSPAYTGDFVQKLYATIEKLNSSINSGAI